MAHLLENISLKKYNTFGIEATARYFFEFEQEEEILEFLKENNIADTQYLILGGGSNLLFTEDFNGLVLHPNITGIELLDEDEESVLLRVGCNEEWDEFVEWAVENQLYGIENLSLIPGTIGASPVQNIGAYGVEVKEVIENVEAISIETKEPVIFSNAHCEFAYRNSVFKNEYKNLFIITHVQFRLKKKAELKLQYGAIQKEMEAYGEINLKNLRKAIIKIRESKLPDPEEIGNAGSFFKNPIVDKEKADKLKSQYENMPTYEISDMETKLAAGWLIEQCDWKGKRFGDAGVHKDQALVLVNYGNAKGNDILKLANDIRKSVLIKFGVKLEMEVNAI
ncbi:UDP-N-acetylmuramate dehydrogenase [Marinifilum caeruleilacunae]|uniref:UDP-N-acetylenolpyruvoylglucosamine reductase n=1 Tax=Marinifilum caeruleilacunae TaxID=2499076 RepID=A0ABX1WYF3_9BACT|nr:UDP-N-acetylmuramate dehydrogenase [Marinifilum caeruleilacunae]NOU60919.1 UDP-N-acetylmuramate dehydrogenase [Marinifilum caeruleilacunae]